MSLTELDSPSLFIPKSNITITANLAETAARIAINNFEWRYLTLVLFNSTILNVVGDFWQLYDKSFIITKGLRRPRYHPEVTRQYILFGKDIADITKMLDWIRGYQFDNTGKYVVICQSAEKCNETEAVASFWYHKITNVVFLKQFDGIVSGYTYFYSADNCAMSAPVKIEDLETCLNLGDDDDACDLFPAKFYDLFGCPLIASTFQQRPYMYLLENGGVKGSDGDLLVIIAKAMNATLEVMKPYYGDGWGTLNEDGQWQGSLGDIYYDLANISMTSAAITSQRYTDFQLSFSYNFAKIGWITSPTKLEGSSLKLVHPFKPDTHAAVCVTYLIVIVTAFLIKSDIFHELNKTIGISPRNSMIFYTWVIFMGLPMSRLPKKPFLLYMVFLWIWYSFFIRTVYQASLMNSLKSKKFASNYETVEELMNANYKIGGGLALQDYFNDYPAVYDNFIGLTTKEVNDTKIRVSRGENFGLSVNLDAADFFIQTYGGAFHVLDQKIVVSPTVIFFKKFSPLARSVNRVLWRLVEAGIPDKLYRIYVQVNKKRPKRVNNQEPITMNHYTGCYALLFCGWILSFLTFLFEILFSKNKHR
ncbi:uncharacterized protein LOC126369840 [Pectinophora gossypiella]|uniref:uncharacterized protein LOC126369840 n=1 Tax=Pectinophora gossypiella TaxID=13191 RepID=UPI00214E4DA7|nr:uncharacterized protein LOC126369840 [Pectinophora gossypiella]